MSLLIRAIWLQVVAVDAATISTVIMAAAAVAVASAARDYTNLQRKETSALPGASEISQTGEMASEVSGYSD